MKERLMTVEEVAEHCRVCYRSVLNWIEAGALPALKAGNQYRVRPADLEAYLERMKKHD